MCPGSAPAKVVPRDGVCFESMRELLHSAVVQLAAVLVAVGLSGVAPWLEAPHAAPVHRCQCARSAGHHDCDCPLCHAEAARAAARDQIAAAVSDVAGRAGELATGRRPSAVVVERVVNEVMAR